MKSYLSKAAWIALAGLTLLGGPARSQEAGEVKEKEKSFWQSVGVHPHATVVLSPMEGGRS